MQRETSTRERAETTGWNNPVGASQSVDSANGDENIWLLLFSGGPCDIPGLWLTGATGALTGQPVNETSSEWQSGCFMRPIRIFLQHSLCHKQHIDGLGCTCEAGTWRFNYMDLLLFNIVQMDSTCRPKNLALVPPCSFSQIDDK